MSSDFGYALSPQQERLQEVQGETAFRAVCLTHLRGAVDSKRLNMAMERITECHEILRTTFFKQPGLTTLLQRINDTARAQLREMELQATNRDDLLEELDTLAETLTFESCENGPLFRAILARASATESWLILALPSLCMDSTGLGNLVQDLAAAYAGDGPTGDDEDTLQYADVAKWLVEMLQDEAEGSAWWTAPQRTETNTPAVPFEGRREHTPNAWRCGLETTRKAAADLQQSAARSGVEPDRILLCAWQVLLARLTGRNETNVAVAFSGRGDEALEDAPGLLTRFLPIPAAVAPEHSMMALIQRLERPLDQASEWEESFNWRDAQQQTLPTFPFAFESLAGHGPFDGGDLSFRIIRRNAVLEPFKLLLTCERVNGDYELRLQYDSRLFQPQAAALILEQYNALLDTLIANPQIPIDKLERVGQKERRRLVEDWSRSSVQTPESQCIHQAIARTASPEATALIQSDQHITYGQLLERVDQVAAHLQTMGVGVEDRVGLAFGRNANLITAMLATLRAGAAYVPLDPNAPAERIAWQAGDAGLDLVLSEQEQAHLLEGLNLRLLLLDKDPIPAAGKPHPTIIRPQNLAYIIYTSGSTGKPKGVCLSHHALFQYVHGLMERLQSEATGSFAGLATQAADLGYTAVFGALLSGGTLHLVPESLSLDANGLAEMFRKQPVDVLKVAPPHLNALLSARNAAALIPRKVLVCGGDALDMGLVERVRALAPHVRIINHYGPTEACVGVLAADAEAPITIGRPLAAARAYICNPRGDLQSTGMTGQLLLGGKTLARAYWSKPALTAERFTPDPFSGIPGARLYHTGDLARFMPDGRVFFLGRNDFQVKIHGHRIEPGEIETVLREHPAVREAVVVPRGEGSEKRLAAYVTAQSGHNPNPETLRAHLAAALPPHMTPALFAVLDAMPLEANGKIDRAALPDPEASSSRNYVPPRNDTERELAAIWEEVIGAGCVGIHDNFFNLGGDSIMTIQVIARARRLGIQLHANQFFEFQTLGELAANAGSCVLVEAEQGTVTGVVPPVPSQKRFFQTVTIDPHHYNQSIMITTPADVNTDALGQALNTLTAHHDLLRARVDGQNLLHEEPNAIPLETVDCSDLEDQNLSDAFTRHATQTQTGFDLEKGPLFRPVYMNAGPGREGRLLLAAHHLLVDGVTWRILVEDLLSGYQSVLDGVPINLPEKTTSFKAWAMRLQEFAASDTMVTEAEWWRERFAAIQPMDLKTITDQSGPEDSVKVALTPAETADLLSKAPAAYNTTINDLLLTALAHALRAQTGSNAPVLVELEGHGREDLFDDMDITRTAGWFTARYPVLLELADNRDMGIKSIKEQLRAIPNHGVGYGILRWLNPELLPPMPAPQISFNYLGRVDQVQRGEQGFRSAPESPGAQKSMNDGNPISILGIADENGLQLNISYGAARYSRQAMVELARHYEEALRRVIEHCSNPANRGYTPSDFPDISVDQARLDKLTAGAENIEAITHLSHIQHGMVFHSMESPGTGVYVVQICCDLIGDPDIAAFRRAWERVVDRFDIFRTRFIGLDESEPLQMVHSRVELPWVEEDWRHMAPTEREDHFESMRSKDRGTDLDFGNAPLMRFKLLRFEDQQYRFVWTYHHALSDGWSTPIVLRALGAFYRMERKGESQSGLPAVPPYRSYIRWLYAQDAKAARNFWRTYLRGYREKLRITIDKGDAGQGDNTSLSKAFDHQTTKTLEAFARQEQLTVNIVAQTAWAVLLGRYGKVNDVVYGGVASGRPPELAGVEHMVGPFLNSVPVRLRYERDDNLLALMHRMMQHQAERDRHSHAPLVEIRRQSELRGGSMFDFLFQYQNYPVGDIMDEDEWSLKFANTRHYDDNNFVLTMIASSRHVFETRVIFRPDRVAPARVETLIDSYHKMIMAMTTDPATTVRDLNRIMDETEKQNRRAGKSVKPMKKLRKIQRKPTSDTGGAGMTAPVKKKGPAKRKPGMKAGPGARSGRKMVTVRVQDLVTMEPLHPDGKLPLVIKPAVKQLDLVEWTEKNADLVKAKMSEHGGILFRGFNVTGVTPFGRFAKHLCGELDVSQEHTVIDPKEKVVVPGFYPHGQDLLWHCEKAYGPIWPRKIIFCCTEPAPKGGESMIVDTRRMLKEMDPAIRRRFEEKQVMYVRNYSSDLGLDWRKVFQTSNREEAEHICRNMGLQPEWKADGNLRTRAVFPAVSRHHYTGEEVWFNQVQHWHQTSFDPETRASLLAMGGPEGMPRNSFFGDGTPIDDSIIEELNALGRKLEAGFLLGRGEILALDNMAVTHGRRAYEGPRTMLVALGDVGSFETAGLTTV